MPVDSEHPQYQESVGKWDVVRSVINSDVKKFIRDIDINDIKRNWAYKSDAILTNFTARTKIGLVGSVFSRDPDVILPDSIKYLEEDATGEELPLVQLAQKLVSDCLEVGRVGLLVDFPQVQGPVSRLEQEKLDLKARIFHYPAESIINWNVEKVGGKMHLTLVVLREAKLTLQEDGFSWAEVTEYRVLRLIDGVYHQLVYDKDHNVIDVQIPLDFDGKALNSIPFTFIGAKNNDADVDPSPLYDLAILNIGHLKNSADYEESVHIVGQPSLFISTSLSHEEFHAANPDGIAIGARKGHILGESGNATLLQAQPNQLADIAMKRKEEQAIMIGARLITPSTGVETAEAARIRYSSENSALATIVRNVSYGLEKALKHVTWFMSQQDSEIQYQLNDQFYDKTIEPNLLVAEMQMLDRKLISPSIMRDQLRRAGIINPDVTDADIEQEASLISSIQPILPNSVRVDTDV